MKRGISFLPLIIFLVVTLAFWNLEATAQTYLPVGPQTNVPIATVEGGGWVQCYEDTYDVEMDADTVLSACTGSRLMLACRETGSSTLTLLAQGNRSDVTFDTGNNQDVTHIANGVGWYFNNSSLSSWGFVRAGDAVEKDNCDVDTSGANDERLCWHLHGAGGYRCGATTDINDLADNADDWERLVFMPAPTPTPTPGACQPGDCNEDGEVNILDVTCVLNSILGL